MAPASLSSWEVEELSPFPDKEWERCDYGPWPPSSRRRGGSGRGLSKYPTGKWGSVVMATPSLSEKERAKEAMDSASRPLRNGEAWPWSSSYQFQNEERKVAMASPIFLLGSGEEWSWPHPIFIPRGRREGGYDLCPSPCLGWDSWEVQECSLIP
mgnify:CR=1 FL=1